MGQNEDVGAAEGRIVTERIIAIGDVHGCSPALASLVRAIDPPALDTLVFLGDYIDRGIRFGIRFSRERPLSGKTPFA